jgi:hypothetical protein
MHFFVLECEKLTTTEEKSHLLRWLRSPRLLFYLTLCLSLLLPSAPLQAAARPAAEAQGPGVALPQQTPPQPQQASAPQTLNFVNGVAQVQGTAGFNQPQVYLFFGAQGQSIRVQLTSQPAGANFEVTGANNTVYKSLADPSLDWSYSLPASQNYRITVNSVTPVVFTLIVTLGGGGGGGIAQRIDFAPGQTVAQVSGSASFGQSPQYVFFANAGQQVRIVLISAGNLANFSVTGASDSVPYKVATDPSRDWTYTLPTSQDYQITVSASSPVNFTLQIYLLGPQPPPAAERINFAPGQSTAVVSGSLQGNVPKYYVVGVPAGQQLRLLLTSSPAGSANFAINGVSDGIVYKQLTDPLREVTIVSPIAQDYLITLFSSVPATYQLEVTVPLPPTALPPTALPPTITPLPTLPFGCTTTTLQNGGFESDGFWVFGDDPVPPAYTSTTIHSGLRAVRLGIDPALGEAVQNKKSFSSVRQPFQIPAEASIAQLRWWNFYRTEEAQTDSPGLGEDQQQVILLNPDLSTHAVLRRVRRNNNAWIEELVDLTPYRGKSLLLYFNAYNDGNGQRTWQFVDDVVINVCYPAVTPTPVVPTPIPTVIAPTMVMPTMVMPTMVMPTVEFPTPIGPTLVAPTFVFPTSPATLLATLFPTAAAMAPVNGQVGNGEPDIVVLPQGQAEVAAAAVRVQGSEGQAAAVQVQIQPVSTPVPPVTIQSGLRVFNRPLTEVLTWAGIMLGALAVIGILVALIWQASRREENIP